MGHTLAYADGYHSWQITILSILTAVFLQVLSNFSNDYGDTIHGADSDDRDGPDRMVQAGLISLSQMKQAMYLMAFLSLAINYTAGDKPYGYSGKGDISVFIFFGLVTVLGSYFLQTGGFSWMNLLPAVACGALSTGVLNVNNIRDIKSDELAGKMSIPVKIGRTAAVRYHALLLGGSVLCLVFFGVLQSYGWSLKWLFLPVSFLLWINLSAVKKYDVPEKLDPYLKHLALSSTALIIAFCITLTVFS